MYAIETVEDMELDIRKQLALRSIDKVLRSNYVYEDLKKLCKEGIVSLALPNFKDCIGMEQENQYHIYTVDEHIIKSVDNVKNDRKLRWVMLLHDIGKPLAEKYIPELGRNSSREHGLKSKEIAEEFLKINGNFLGFSEKEIEDMLILIEHHDIWILYKRLKQKDKHIKKDKLVEFMSENSELFLEFEEVFKADVLAQNPAYLAESLKYIEEFSYEVRKKGKN